MIKLTNAGNNIFMLMSGIINASKGASNLGPQPTDTHKKNASLAGKREADQVKTKAMYANNLRTFSKGAKGTIKPR